MIYYQPTTGDPHTAGIASRPRHCFLMTQLGGHIHPELQAMRGLVETVLGRHRFTVIDADSQITGREYLAMGGRAQSRLESVNSAANSRRA
jgi:hypothetical protein